MPKNIGYPGKQKRKSARDTLVKRMADRKHKKSRKK